MLGERAHRMIDVVFPISVVRWALRVKTRFMGMVLPLYLNIPGHFPPTCGPLSLVSIKDQGLSPSSNHLPLNLGPVSSYSFIQSPSPPHLLFVFKTRWKPSVINFWNHLGHRTFQFHRVPRRKVIKIVSGIKCQQKMYFKNKMLCHALKRHIPSSFP